MVNVGDRIRLSSTKGPDRDGVVTAVTGSLLRVRWPTDEETTVAPAPGTLTVLAAGDARKNPAPRKEAARKKARAEPVGYFVVTSTTRRERPISRREVNVTTTAGISGAEYWAAYMLGLWDPDRRSRETPTIERGRVATHIMVSDLPMRGRPTEVLITGAGGSEAITTTKLSTTHSPP